MPDSCAASLGNTHIPLDRRKLKKVVAISTVIAVGSLAFIVLGGPLSLVFRLCVGGNCLMVFGLVMLLGIRRLARPDAGLSFTPEGVIDLSRTFAFGLVRS